MEESEDIFADLLSGLQPSVTATREAPREEVVSMEEQRRKALSDTDADGVPVRRSNSPVGENLRPPPPPLTKDEMQCLVRENVRELLFQSFGALTTTLRVALTGITDKLAKVECVSQELNLKVEKLSEKWEAESGKFTESFHGVDATLKEISVGVQRMLEKQDLLDAHVLLNRHAREERQEKHEKEAEEVKKTEKRAMHVKTKEAVEEDSEEEEENPPEAVVVPKVSRVKRTQPAVRESPRPVPTYVPQPEIAKEELDSFYGAEKEVKSPAVYVPEALARPQVNAAQPFSPQIPQQPPVQPTPVQPAMPPQPVYQAPSVSRPPVTNPYKPQPPQYGYPTAGMEHPYPPPMDKPRPPQHAYSPPMQSNQFASPPPPPPPQQQPPPQQPPPMHYPGYPSMPVPPYRPMHPGPPPGQQQVYGSPASLQNPKVTPPQRDAARTTSQTLPLDQVINDVANMGFDRTKVRSVVTEMLDHGESVDLNVVIDRLTNMGY